MIHKTYQLTLTFTKIKLKRLINQSAALGGELRDRAR